MDISKLRHLQNIFSTAASGDLTVMYYKRGKTGTSPITGLPSSESAVYSGYDKRHLITPIDTVARTHRFKFNLQNCTEKVNFLGWATRMFKHNDNVLDLDDMKEGAVLKRLRTSSTQLLLTHVDGNLRTE